MSGPTPPPEGPPPQQPPPGWPPQPPAGAQPPPTHGWPAPPPGWQPQPGGQPPPGWQQPGPPPGWQQAGPPQGWPPPPGWQPGPARPERYAGPLEYHQLYRGGRPGWHWAGLASPFLAIAFLLLGPAIVLVPFMIGFVVAGEPVLEGIQGLVDLADPTPLGLAYLNLALASAILFTFLAVWALYGLAPRWLTSVRPRMRWGFFAACVGLAMVALVATVVVAMVVPTDATGAELTGEINEFTRTTRDFALVVLLLTPLQAAGEEYLFRGYLTQAIGSLFKPSTARLLSRTVAVVVPALAFALAHGAGQSVPIFFDRFAFGLVAGVLVIATGGLEAAIAMHVLNNWLAFGVALAFGDMGSALNPSGGTWWSIPVTLTQSLVYLGLALWVARAMRLDRTGAPAVLAASRRRV